ncbi:relaxase/mobilization nuclease domain-containing protein [Helicobacter pylori]|uniref:relaxase/mobilization nuclease domain-containing protein n=1 Tax=Helicobacter pylori TaxID=210 RepID=UPI0019395A9A|nr:relaxase/mobilization nuclease domain-containing protein [Helicobacter pylori]MBM2778691.1 relaxase/mobilization nuclease domain-containing protein [Helicobacter pylori]
MALEKSYSKNFESDELFDYEIIKPKKTLKIQYTYAKRYYEEVEKFAKNSSQLTQEEFMRLREPQKQVVIKNIGNMTRLHSKRAMDYIAKYGELVRDEFFNEVNYNDIAEQWNEQFEKLLENKSRVKNCALHLVFSIDENCNEKNLKALELSVYQTLTNTLGYDYPFIMKLHTHQNNPHVHVIINKTNKITNKQLRFHSKDSCKEFYHTLRETFKDYLFANSKGELQYSNTPNIYKAIKYIETELDALEKQARNNKSFRHENYFYKVLGSATSQIESLKKRENALSDHLDNLKNLLEKTHWEKENFTPPTNEKELNQQLKEVKWLNKESLTPKNTYKKIQKLAVYKSPLIKDYLYTTKKLFATQKKIIDLEKDYKDLKVLKEEFSKDLESDLSHSKKRFELYTKLKSMGKVFTSKSIVKNLEKIALDFKSDRHSISQRAFEFFRYMNYQNLSLTDKSNMFLVAKFFKDSALLVNIARFEMKKIDDSVKNSNPQDNLLDKQVWLNLLEHLKRLEEENYCFAKKRKEFLETRAMELSKDLKFLTQANENDLPIYERGQKDKIIKRCEKSLNFLQKELQCFKTLSKSASIALENLQSNHQITAVTQDTQENTNALKNTTQDFNKTTNEPTNPNNNYEMDF